MTDKPAFPVYVFVRRRDFEIEAGFALAGILIVDIPESQKFQMEHSQKQKIQKIIGQLCAMARAGEMGDDAFIYGWPDGAKPANAADVHDDALMWQWAKKCIKITITIDPRDDVRIDSDLARELGLMQEH
jgi:hypothetical protein